MNFSKRAQLSCSGLPYLAHQTMFTRQSLHIRLMLAISAHKERVIWANSWQLLSSSNSTHSCITKTNKPSTNVTANYYHLQNKAIVASVLSRVDNYPLLVLSMVEF